MYVYFEYFHLRFHVLLIFTLDVFFVRQRILDRSELFDKGRGEILDQVVNLCEVNVKHWEDMLAANLWNKVKDIVFENIYFSAAHSPENGKRKKINI